MHIKVVLSCSKNEVVVKGEDALFFANELL
jgi:hypothetical protein